MDGGNVFGSTTGGLDFLKFDTRTERVMFAVVSVLVVLMLLMMFNKFPQVNEWKDKVNEALGNTKSAPASGSAPASTSTFESRGSQIMRGQLRSNI